MKTVEEIVSQSAKVLDFIGNDFEIFRMAGDASSREYFRILFDGKQTCTLMLLPEGAASMAEEYESDKLQITQLPFLDVQKLLQSKQIRVPDIYVDDVENRMILLEDLGDEALVNILISNPEKYLHMSLDLLSQIANPHPETIKDSIAFARSFDEDLYMWEFQHYIEYGIEKIIDFKDSDIPKIQGIFHGITKQYCDWETHLCHRDFHSKNIHLLSKSELALIDFQDALLGPVYYDLVSLLKDAYTKLDRSLQESLALYYKNKLDPSMQDAKLSDDEFLFRFDLMSLHRNLKAAGRFVYIDQVKNNPNYLKDVPQALSYAIETVNLHSDLKGLKTVLEPYMQKLIEEV